jgi:hypothetical protein
MLKKKEENVKETGEKKKDKAGIEVKRIKIKNAKWAKIKPQRVPKK